MAIRWVCKAGEHAVCKATIAEQQRLADAGHIRQNEVATCTCRCHNEKDLYTTARGAFS